MNNFVTASASSPGGRRAGWAGRRTPSALTPGGPYASGPKYGLDRAALGAPARPLVLVPEVAFGSSENYWAVTRAGRLRDDPAALARLIDDCCRRLAVLRSPSGRPYLAPGIASSSMRRLFLSGHSAGGVPVSHSAGSAIARQVPSDLWLLDATYNSPLNPNVVAFARHWRQWSDPARPGAAPVNRLGNAAGTSRLAIFARPGTLPDQNAMAIVAMLRQPWRDSRGRFAGLTAARFERGRMRPMDRQPLPAQPELVVVAPDASAADVADILRRTPVTVVRTAVGHDRIPLEYTPVLLNTAAPV
jgi:hypothetical protein